MPPSGSYSVWSYGFVIVGGRTNFRIDLRNTSDKIGQIVYESNGERQCGQMDSLFKTLPNPGGQLTKTSRSFARALCMIEHVQTTHGRMQMFEGFDPVILARAQFAFTMSFHIIFPAFSIGLASYLAVLEALWLWTGRDVFLNLFNYWLKIFAVAFGMGVVSGIVMSYQFGTNWSAFSDKAGPIIGPLMAYEVLTAFFLEAGFLGVMLFGLKRVGPRLHFFATLMVAIGTLFSAFWILSANSWMQTPAGYSINAAGQFVAADWWKVIFNPSFPYRLVHMVLAAYLTTAFVVGAVGAWHLLKDTRLPGPRVMFSMAMWMATLVAPLQILAGDQHGLNTLEHQPTKIMAMEGHFESHPHGAPLILFGLPSQAEGKVNYAIEIPKLGSLILKHDLNAPMAGLDTVPRENWPPVPVTFWSFRIMVGIGFLMLGLGLLSLFMRFRGKFYESRLLHSFALAMGPAGFIAVLAGWVTTETGRQPFTVFGLLRTSDSVSPLAAPAVASSLIAFAIVYFLVFAAGTIYLLRLMAAPPHHDEQGPAGNVPSRAAGITPAVGATASGHAS
ncbi:cytochrome d ubiquinol oxidase subunit I [Tardiphaga sp. OK245]|nr:cytochrome d ubiquinol oxidase subunit I [Tardiphaga sp. OK245]